MFLDLAFIFGFMIVTSIVYRKIENTTMRRLLFFRFLSSLNRNAASQSQNPSASTNSDSPAPSPSSPSPSSSQSVSPAATPSLIDPPNRSSLLAPTIGGQTEHKSAKNDLIVPLVIGGIILFIISIATTYFLCYRAQKAASVMPWATGLSGKLQKAFITGMLSFERLILLLCYYCIHNYFYCWQVCLCLDVQN